MKKILSLLVVFTFLQVQSWALVGGPQFGDGGSGNIATAGTYAGALLPTATSGGTADANGFNGLGIFAIVIPTEGLGQGSFYYFSSGNAFVGTVSGIADPEKDTFVGVVNGQASISLGGFSDIFGDTATFTQSLATVGGGLFATFSQDSVGLSGSGATGVRLSGTADLDILIPGTPATTTTDAAGNTVTTPAVPDQITSLQLVVDGFQQSTNTTALSTTGFPTLATQATGS